MSVIWENYLWDKEKPLTPGELVNAETVLGVQFPDDYKAIVMQNQGKSPSPACFKINPKRVGVFSSLLHFCESGPESSYVLWNYNTLREFLPEKIIPFADTPGGDFICFDFREDSVKVVYASHEKSGEQAITPLADTFSGFIDSLYEEE